MAIDPSYSIYANGKATFTKGSDIVGGQFTLWTVALQPLDFILALDANGLIVGMSVVKTILTDLSLQVAALWQGPSIGPTGYFCIRWTDHTNAKNYGPQISAFLEKVANVPTDIDAFLTALNAAVLANQQSAQTVTAGVQASEAAQNSAAQSATSASNSATAAGQAQATAAAYAGIAQGLAAILGDYGDQETTGSGQTGDFGDQS